MKSTTMKKLLLTTLATAGVLTAPLMFTAPAAAQRVVDVSPGINSQNIPGDTSIYGQFDPGTGPAVDVNSVRIFVNNQNVTSRSTVTPGFFSYRPDQALPPGQVQVRVEYLNVRGEARTASWMFTVRSPQSNLQISAVTHNAATGPLGPGTTLLATINGTPGAQGTVLLIQDGRTVRELPAQEVSAGVYVATLPVQASDRVAEGIVVGRLRRQDQVTYGTATQAVVLSSSASGSVVVPSTPGTGSTGSGSSTPPTGTTATVALQPRFTSHQDGQRVSGSGFTLVGQTRPNATVNVNITASLSVLGVVNLGSETLVNRDVTANSNGEFRVDVPAPRIPTSGTRYAVRATARSGSETSTTTRLNLSQQ